MDQLGSDLADLIAAAPVAAPFFVLAVASCLYTLLAFVSVRRFKRCEGATKPWKSPGVTVLKPLYGVEEGLYENLLSFCRQTYSGPVQILLGVHEPDDTAASIARRIVAAARAGRIEGAPARLSVELVVDPTLHGTNGKVSNLINLSRRIENELVVLADSDIMVAPDYLDRLAASLQRPGVGIVTCLYRGRPLAGFWSRLGAMGVDYGFLPNVLTGLALNMARPCVGATIALRRCVLGAIGGFESVKDQLADDYALGEAVRARGLKVVLADFVVGHAHARNRDLKDVWRRDMRWARTIRAVDPARLCRPGGDFSRRLGLARRARQRFCARSPDPDLRRGALPDDLAGRDRPALRGPQTRALARPAARSAELRHLRRQFPARPDPLARP